MHPNPDQLAAAATSAGHLISAITDSQWDLPTPCGDWNVRDVVAHIVSGNHAFSTALDGHAGTPTPIRAMAAPSVESDPVDGYQQSVAVLLKAFRRPRALEQTVTVPFGTVPASVALHLRITELLVHGWDLANATGQLATFPAGLAEQELAFSRAALANMPADRQPFGPRQPVAHDARPIDQLAACLGRTVDATNS